MKKILNKWQYGIKIGKCPFWKLGFHPFIRTWFLKLVSFPNEGEMIAKENYKGFMINKEWSPIITFQERTFRVFGKYIRIVYPIKLTFK